MNAVAPPGWRLRRYESLGSTSDLCATLAAAGEPDRLAVLAARQTHARGSRGRTWQTLPGNLAVSVVLRPTSPASHTGQWALLAAVALAEAIEAGGAVEARLKWPNDVMLGDAKAGGILIDTALDARGRLDWLVLGFGANLARAPDLPQPVAVVPGGLDPGDVAAILLHRLDHWDRVRLLDGFAPVRRAWLDRGPAPGSAMRVRWGGTDLGGTFAGLAEDGALLLQSGGRVRALPTGEVLQSIGE